MNQHTQKEGKSMISEMRDVCFDCMSFSVLFSHLRRFSQPMSFIRNKSISRTHLEPSHLSCQPLSHRSVCFCCRCGLGRWWESPLWSVRRQTEKRRNSGAKGEERRHTHTQHTRKGRRRRGARKIVTPIPDSR